VRAAICLVVVLGCQSAASTPEVQPGSAAGNEGSARGQSLLLSPGQVAEIELDAGGRAGVRLLTPAGNEQFVLILGSTAFDVEPTLFDYSVSLDEAGPLAPFELVTTCALPSESWSQVPMTVEPAPAAQGPRPGATRTIYVTMPEGGEAIEATVISVGEHATIWADTTHPTSLDLAFAEQFRADFESIILPRARQIFGTEPDIDGDGRIQLVFSKLTRERGVAFFSGCDLLGSLEGCSVSNRGEYLYLTPPDAIDPPYNTANAIKEILTHELSHLLHFNRKLLKNGISQWPDSVYAAEGIGALAQDVVGYQSGNLYVAKAGLDGIDGFSLADVLDARQRQGAPDGVLRGAAYLFVRYLYDRAGGDAVDALQIQNRGGPAFIRALIDARESVAAALPTVGRVGHADLGLDFFTALALSNRDQRGAAAPANPCFAFLPTERDPVTGNQRGTNVFAEFHGTRMNGPHVSDATAPDGKLRAGGVDYLSVAARGAEVELALNVDPKAAARLRVARWK
jgi:hypothetical protein